MTRGGKRIGKEQQLAELLNELRTADRWLDNHRLRKLAAYGANLIPELENILTRSLESARAAVTAPGAGGGYAVLHALFLLAHLRAEKSLSVILKFLSQKPDFLDCYLHDSLLDEIWEVVFHLGVNQISELEKFILNRQNNTLSRLAVCTALVQLALHHPRRKRRVEQVFQKLLRLKKDDIDFVGLVISELLDLKSAALRPLLLAALEKNKVWSGIISAEDISRSYKNQRARKLTPTDLFERYKLYTHFAYVTPIVALQSKRRTEKSL